MQDEATTQLLERLRRRDPSACEELVRTHHVAVRAYLATRLVDRSAVDDVAQEVFVEATRSVAGFRGDSSVSTWLLGIARHRALQHARTEGRRRKRHEVAQALEAVAREREVDAAAELAVFETHLARLRLCIEALAPSSRALVERHYFGGEPLARLAAEAQRKEPGLRMMLLRIRKALRRCLDGEAVGEEGP